MSVRAFELTPVIQRVKLTSSSGQSRTQIVCLECCGRNIYVGTDDCFVVHYLMEETTGPNGMVMISTHRQNHKYLALKKAVVDLKVASALNRILVLCDNTLTLLNMFDLEPILGGAKIKGVVSVCVNSGDGNPFAVEICVALKKKVVQVYTVTEDKFLHVKDVHLPENPLRVSMSGSTICIAGTSQYLITNYDTGQVLDLFPYGPDFTNPMVLRVAKDEFLLSGPSALGMFVTSAGISERPPLQWSDHLVNMAFYHPYILAMNDEFITVHSILDQQQKQTMSFTGGRVLGQYDGRIFVASSKEVLALVPVAVEKQIQSLLSEKRVAEALEIAKTSRSLVTDKHRFSLLFKKIQQQAGFVELAACRWDEARDLFKLSAIDVREVISLYPGLMISSSSFNRAVPPLHEIADIHQLSGGDTEKQVLYKKFLVDFLEDIRETPLAKSHEQEVDTALLKLYAAARPHEILPFLASTNHCHLEDSVLALQRHCCYYILGMMYKFNDQMDKALETWTKIADGEYADPSFPGLEFIVEILTNLDNHDLVWQYLHWTLSKDEQLGITILTDRPGTDWTSDRLHPDAVIDYIDPARYPHASIIYLEFLVFTMEMNKEKYHTHLALSYLDEISLLRKRNDTTDQLVVKTRSKLQRLLRLSSHYRVQTVLSRVKDTDLYVETAILYGKLEDHDQALRILVNKLCDYTAAHDYCLYCSQGRDLHYKRRLFHLLLGVYLDPHQRDGDGMIMAAMDLLNHKDADFDVVKVIQQLPDSWSASFLEEFLSRSVRETLHKHRTTRIQCQLSRTVNLHLKQDVVSLSKKPVSISENRSCQCCKRSFYDAEFTYYPNGVICHSECAKSPHQCPVTGKVFTPKTP